MYVILKEIRTEKGVVLPVVMMTIDEEIWEFDDKDKAQKMADILELNSDSGHKYTIKKI